MLLIDDRAGSRDLIKQPPLAALAEAGTASLSRLDSADVAMSGNGPDGPMLIGVEHKSISDLLSSLDNGRFSSEHNGQLPALASTYQLAYLLLYGWYRPNPDSGNLQLGRHWPQKAGPHRITVEWKDYGYGMGNGRCLPYSYIESFLCSPSFLRFNVKVKHVNTFEESAVWIAALYKTWSKPYDGHSSTQVFNKAGQVPQQGMDLRMHRCALVASDLLAGGDTPGLGHKRAIAAATHFDGSVRRMVNASREEWAEVVGVGKVLARAVTEAVK